MFILYSLLRLIDDMVDSEITKEDKYAFLSMFDRFLNEVYKNHLSDQELLSAISSRADIRSDVSNIDWNYYVNQLTTQQLSVFRGFSRIAYYLPRKPFENLIRGFQWDIEGKLVKDESEYLQNAMYVSGNTAVIIMFTFWYKLDDWPIDFENIGQRLIENGADLGLVIFDFILNFIND